VFFVSDYSKSSFLFVDNMLVGEYNLAMTEKQENQIVETCEADKNIALLYLFGSQARGDAGPMSDHDFAIQFDGLSVEEQFNKKLDLMSRLASILKTDTLDLVVMNTLDKPELKLAIIQEGKIIFEREDASLEVEPAALREYEDFNSSLIRFGLVPM